MTEPVVAQKAPYGIDLEKGNKYAWCACGLSQKQPFCDGSHKVTELRPVVFTADESKKVWFCGCKHTKKQPYCDGTHKGL
ncbi:MAG: CDGSH iron-sulfur domain-containing protein [Alphaproteobacteria bacterium]